MPEVELDFPRQWVEFPDPTNPEVVIFRCDLTWLTSNWACIYGRGCKGVIAESPDSGCCALGAHFADDDDRKRVTKSVPRLTPEDWEHHGQGQGKKWLEKDDEGALKTRIVNNACIFSNSSGFAGGMGCAFHALAQREGIHPLEVKPDVCWQLPISRSYERVTRDDGTEVLVVTVTEFSRRNWGAGGHSLDWYCSGNTEAHIAAQPVYQSSRAELSALIGPEAYDILAEHCAAREAVMAQVRAGQLPAAGGSRKQPVFVTIEAFAPHPADQR
jgi:hypothetical protein